MRAAPEPPLQRRRRVLAEVEPVAADDRLEQEGDLDLLDVARLGRHRYWYSQTRISESSWSVSTGFAM